MSVIGNVYVPVRVVCVGDVLVSKIEIQTLVSLV